jgi:SNF2 family DNA or RNA helicase
MTNDIVYDIVYDNVNENPTNQFDGDELDTPNFYEELYGNLSDEKRDRIENVFSKVQEFVEGLGVTYYPHQEEGIKWMIKQAFFKKLRVEPECRGGLLCDDPGLGKTLQTLSLIKALEMTGKLVHGRVLIVVPIALLEQWRVEAEKFFPGNVRVNHNRLTLMTTKQSVLNNSKLIVITSYSKIFNTDNKEFVETGLHKVPWDAIVCDEVHIIRNNTTYMAKGCQSINAKYRFGLSGTPIQNKIDDIKSLFQYLGIDPKLLRNTVRFEDLMKPYNVILRRNRHILMDAYKNLDVEIHAVKFATEEESDFYHKLKAKIREEYNKICEESGESNVMSQILELLLRLRQATIHPCLVYNGYIAKTLKDDEADDEWKARTVELLKNKSKYWSQKQSSKIMELIKLFRQHETNTKSMIITQYREEANLIYQHLGETFPDLNIAIFDGTSSVDDRNKIIKRCHAGLVDVLILQIKSGGVGLNLQMFHNVYSLSPDWNPSNEIQAIARCHRIGQTRDVKVVKLVMHEDDEKKATIDERLISIQTTKREMMARCLNDDTLEFNEMVRYADIQKLTKKEWNSMFK